MTIEPSDNSSKRGWSLGEAASLATKAARGAGMPWGLADETGFAVRWLHARNMPGLVALSRYLEWREKSSITNWPDKVTGDSCYCPIAIGTGYLDGALSAPVTIKKIREPILILPFIAERSGARPVKVQFNDLCLLVSYNGVLCRYLCLLYTSPSPRDSV